jgi:hypothetical protein
METVGCCCAFDGRPTHQGEMQKTCGRRKGARVFYASARKDTIRGVERRR